MLRIKIKTSKKRKAFSFKGMPIRKLKPGITAKTHDPDKRLRNAHLITKALLQCLWEGDIKAFKEIVRAHYEAINTAETLRKIGLSKRTFYEATSLTGNPSLNTVSKIIRGMKEAA